MAEVETVLGCKHYKRKCKLVSPCCRNVYICRFCHDEKENHVLNRKDVEEIICLRCETRQKVQLACEQCSVVFGQYFCAFCKLFDDEDKQQFHCDGCGICRIGGRDKFFHCEKCDMCLPLKLENKHKCIEKVSRANCTVCLEDIHTSRIPSHIPPCGHLIHRTCFEDLLKAGHYACPTCQVSMFDMAKLWSLLDEEIQVTPMPTEYQNYSVSILCRDCHEVSVTNYHVVGLKCQSCGSYNTCRERGAPIRNQASSPDLGPDPGPDPREQVVPAEEVEELVFGEEEAEEDAMLVVDTVEEASPENGVSEEAGEEYSVAMHVNLAASEEEGSEGGENQDNCHCNSQRES